MEPAVVDQPLPSSEVEVQSEVKVLELRAASAVQVPKDSR